MPLSDLPSPQTVDAQKSSCFSGSKKPVPLVQICAIVASVIDEHLAALAQHFEASFPLQGLLSQSILLALVFKDPVYCPPEQICASILMSIELHWTVGGGSLGPSKTGGLMVVVVTGDN